MKSPDPAWRWWLLPLLGLLTQALAAVDPPLVNQLADDPSPYLAMHGHDPVAWQHWGPEVLARARREGKLIYISSGYFACHWCHVMQRESYSDPDIARRLNAHFIPVKLDRELDPALDAYLIDFVESLRGQAGWPLNVFITPDGYPLFGFTYLPRDRFATLLDKLQDQWAKERPRLERLARRSAAIMARQSKPEATGATLPKAEAAARRLRQAALEVADELGGGFGQTSRFPMAPALLALLEIQSRTPDRRLGHFLRLTLDRMAAGGLRDHLGGGFFRYTTDPDWRRPHFEKMLYTNALLARVYLRAARVLQQPAYLDVARETLDFLLRDMRRPDGSFIDSFSAVDDQGREGGYYLFTADELKTLLPATAFDLAWRYYGLEDAEPLDHGYLLIPATDVASLAKATGQSRTRVRQHLADIRRRLLQARARRRLPVDDKVLSGWNALVLSALVEAGRTLPHADRYRAAARRLHHRLLADFVRGDRVLRGRSAHGPMGKASLQDYAYLADALWRYQRSNGTRDDRPRLRRLLEAAWRRFHDSGGWRLGDDLLLPALGGRPALADGPMPAPPAVLMDVSLRTGLRPDRTRQALRQAWPLVRESAFWYASYVPLYGRE